MAHPRTKSRDRCESCRLRRVLCVCELIPRFNLETRITLLLHKREAMRPTNTGRLLTLVLSNSEMRVRGKKDEPMSDHGLLPLEYTSLYLYPSESAVELTQAFVSKIKNPINLVVPDGSWRQASKVKNREKSLRDVVHVKVTSGPPPRLFMRRETKPHGMSTFEAVSRALGVIEGADVQRRLEVFFKYVAERSLWSRGRLQTSECETKIPDAAFI